MGDATITVPKVQDQGVKDITHAIVTNVQRVPWFHAGTYFFPSEVRHFNLSEGVSCFRLCNQRKRKEQLMVP